MEQSYQGETWKIASGVNGQFSYRGYLDYSTKKAAENLPAITPDIHLPIHTEPMMPAMFIISLSMAMVI